MATVNASVSAARAALPQQLVKPNLQGADVQILVSTITVPVGGVAIGDKISWGLLPFGARLMPGTRLYFAAGTASSTINLGDPAAPARYMAATSVATAGSATADAQFTNGALFEVTVAQQGLVTDQSELLSTVAGAALLAGQVITLVAHYAGQN